MFTLLPPRKSVFADRRHVAMTRLTFSLILLLAFCHSSFGHDLPDGEIERRVQISVKPDRVLIEYTIAMNDVTLGKQLKTQLEKDGTQPAEETPERWKQYQELALRMLPEKVSLKVDGKTVPLKGLRASVSGWSHPHLVCLLKADVQTKRSGARISVTDGNFPDAPGQFRIAMKGRSGASIENASVPTTVSRAKGVSLEDLTNQQRRMALTAKGEIVLDQPE